jgi:hypothetical protein
MTRSARRRYACFTAAAAACLLATLLLAPAARAQVLFELKTGFSGTVSYGSSVAMSGNGQTLIVGDPSLGSGIGQVCVLPLVGKAIPVGYVFYATNAVGAANQGSSVAMSADGNTFAFGGPRHDSQKGAVWVFSRANAESAYAQQATIQGTGVSVTAAQGSSVALSSDGNTLIVGCPGDAAGVGAAFVFVRANGTWTQQGAKLVGQGVAQGQAGQGFSVALSADGNTAIVGGQLDNNDVGAAWVFARDGMGNWSQQGNKLTGSSAVGEAYQGHSVAMSGDGKTAIIGGPGHFSGNGAAWVFVNNNGTWTQQAPLQGTGFTGSPSQGSSVALSLDGNTALVGRARQ